MIETITGQQTSKPFVPPVGGIVLMVCCGQRYESIEASAADHPISETGVQSCPVLVAKAAAHAVCSVELDTERELSHPDPVRIARMLAEEVRDEAWSHAVPARQVWSLAWSIYRSRHAASSLPRLDPWA